MLKASPAGRTIVSGAFVLGLLALAGNETRAQSCTAPDFKLPPATVPVGDGPRGIAVLDINRDGALDVVTADTLQGTITFGYGDGMGGFAGSFTPLVVAVAQPWAVAVADFDRDGTPDVAVGDLAGNTVQALLGDGVGGIQLPLPAPVTVGPAPMGLAAGDFNRDGIPDLVSANTSGTVQLVVGMGNGTFAALPPGILPLPGAPRAVVAGDFNRDGFLDAAVADPAAGPPAVHLVLGNGAGGWLGSTPFPVPLGQPTSLAAGDLDLDGDLDLAVGDAAGPGVVALLGNGGGNFVVQPPLPGLLPLTTSVVLADLDSDGVLDLATTGLGSGAVAVALGDGAGAFAGFTPFPVGEDPFALAAADFDGDGRVDLAGSGEPVDQAVLLVNQFGIPCPNASFAGAGRLQVLADDPEALVSGDWNGDGVPDLAAADSWNLSIFTGDGTLRFSVPATLALGPNAPKTLAVADFDLDGDPDLAVSGQTNSLRLFRNTGGTFAAAGVLPLATMASQVVSGDFNGDGAPDLVSAHRLDGLLTFQPGQGDLTFGPPVTTPIGLFGHSSLVAADFDGDLLLDVAVSSDFNNLVEWFKGDGAGGFTPGGSHAVGSFPVALAAGDLNGDLWPDLVTANGLSDDVAVLLNLGGAGFAPATFAAVGDAPLSVAIGETSGDGWADVVVANRDSDDVMVLLGDGAGGFPSSTTAATDSQPRPAVLVDADRNGTLDLAVVVHSSSGVGGSLVVLPGDGAGRFGPLQVSPGTDNQTVMTGDFDRDGKPDLVTVDEGSTDFSFHKGWGDGTFEAPATFPTGLTTPRGAGAGDFDGNGTLDLLIGDWVSPNVAYLAGNGAGGFAAPVPIVSGGNDTSRHHIAVADFDRDGNLDFVKVNGAPGSVTIHFGNGAGAFVSPVTIVVGADLTDIAVLDFNRDGILDVVVSDIVTDELHLLEGRGVRATPFTLRPNQPTGQEATGLAAGDFDGDGIEDLVVGHAGEIPPTLGFFRGNATAPNFFDARQDYGLGDTALLQPSGVAAADLNADGHPDVLVACRGGTTDDRSSVRVLLGTGDPTPGNAFLAADTWAVAQAKPSVIRVEDFDRNGKPDFVTGAFISVFNRTAVVLNTNCLERRLRLTRQPSLCNVDGAPFPTQPAVQVEDHGSNPIQCNDVGDPVSVGIVPGTGTAGASLAGDNPLATTAGVADWATALPLSIDLPGVKYRLEFTHPLAGRTFSQTFSVSPGLTITGPAGYCAADPGLFSTDPGFDTYRWFVDGAGPASFASTLTIPAATLAPGPHDAQVDATVDSCPVSDLHNFDVFANLSSVSVAPLGPFSVCSTCLGPTLSVSETGGGALSRQWGYRRVSAGTVFDIPGQTGPSYILNGSDFPGVGTYYVVETTTPACGSPLVSVNEVEVTVTTMTPADDVEFFTVTSRSTENVLEWVYPAGFNTVSIHATSGPTCVPPTDPLNLGTLIINEPGAAGMRHRFPHGGLTPGTTYCYTLFVDTGGGTYSAGRSNRGRPMIAPGAVLWAFSTGVFSLTAPTVGGAGVIATSNDHVVHAMVRGASPPAGEWPALWLPKPVGGPVQSRSPIIPIDVGPLPSNPVVYIGSQDGNVYVVDGARGGAVLDPWAPVSLGGLSGQAAPAGMFSVWGTYDHLLVGTREMGANNRFYAIDPINGGPPTDFYDNLSGTGGVGIINAMAAVDYLNERVYFTSHRNGLGSPSTLWCLNLLSQTAPVFSLRWERDLDDIDSSPVLMGGRVYVGSIDNGGRVFSVNADTGADYFFDHGDGQVKDFVWPDWRNPGDLYFAGNTSIWALHDDGGTLDYKPPLVAPVSLGGAIPTSAVLLVPGTQFLYVGADDGHLYEIDFSQDPPFVKSVQLGDGGAAVGAPSLDWPNDLIHVGTEAGIFYAVDIPLP